MSHVKIWPKGQNKVFINVNCITLFSLDILVNDLFTFTGWPHELHPGQRTLSWETITIYLLLCIVRQSWQCIIHSDVSYIKALNPRGLHILECTLTAGASRNFTAALYVSCGMFPNNTKNIYNLRKLHQLLFHFCQQDTLFTQHFNHNSDCKQCPGNLVLTLDWNLCLCRSVCTLIISTAVPRFFKCSWLLKSISHDIHLSFLLY